MNTTSRLIELQAARDAAWEHLEEILASNYGADNPGAVYAAEDRLAEAETALAREELAVSQPELADMARWTPKARAAA